MVEKTKTEICRGKNLKRKIKGNTSGWCSSKRSIEKWKAMGQD